jgi:site-specific recombinase XerD
LLDEVLQEYVCVGRKSLYEVRLRLERHLRPAFGNVRASSLTTIQIKSYIAARQKHGAANATINRELSILKRAFNLALNADPPAVTRSPHIPLLSEDNVRDGFLETDAYEALRQELPEYF